LNEGVSTSAERCPLRSGESPVALQSRKADGSADRDCAIAPFVILVIPGKLRAAIRIATENRPRVVKGDLRTDLAGLVAEAPKDATLIVFHTAVLAYIRSPTERDEFARSVRSLCDFWISNESPRIFPEIAARIGNHGPKGRFLMSVNGVPVGWTDPHGASLDWISQLPDMPTASDSNVAGFSGRYPR
jgi:hypothetical protein